MPTMVGAHKHGSRQTPTPLLSSRKDIAAEGGRVLCTVGEATGICQSVQEMERKMPTVRYTVAQGEVIAEKRGGVRSLYTPDPLGSTIALIDNTQTITDTWVYWPYGEVKTRTGTTATPFQYVGTQGYYHDSDGRAYVRARYLDKAKARWLTEDSLGLVPDANSYRYVNNSPVVYADASGLILGSYVPRDPYGDYRCTGCAGSIIGNWWSLPQHWCNPNYTHCMACCILTRAAGEKCADYMQSQQNFFCPSKIGHVWRNRFLHCREGIKAAKNRGGTCHAKCIELNPPPTGWPPDREEYCKKHQGDLNKPLRSPCERFGVKG